MVSIIEQFGSIDERLEKFNSWKDHTSKYLKRGVELDPNDNVCVVRGRYDESKNEIYKEWFYTHNIVTNSGDLFYAQQAVAETPTVDYDSANNRQELRTGAATPAKGDTYNEVTTPVTASRKVADSTYPKTNDGDSDNTGAGTDIVTWLTSWTTGDFNQTGIIGGCIHNAAGSPVSTSTLLTHWSITSFDKTATDTLKIFVNHTFNGV